MDSFEYSTTNFSESWLNKGVAFSGIGQVDDAIKCFDRAIILNPNYAEAFHNKGFSLFNLNHFSKALNHYDKAISLKPNYAEAWLNKGNIFYHLKKYDQALSYYSKAESCNPDQDWILGLIFHTKMQVCDWNGFYDNLDVIINKIKKRKKAIMPLSILSLTDSPQIHKIAAKIYARYIKTLNCTKNYSLTKVKPKKIRLGYFSADFHNHATSHLMAEIFELHNQNKFDLIAVSFGPKTNDDVQLRVSKSFNQFINVNNFTDDAIIKICKELNFDIAIDLKG